MQRDVQSVMVTVLCLPVTYFILQRRTILKTATHSWLFKMKFRWCCYNYKTNRLLILCLLWAVVCRGSMSWRELQGNYHNVALCSSRGLKWKKVPVWFFPHFFPYSFLSSSPSFPVPSRLLPSQNPDRWSRKPWPPTLVWIFSLRKLSADTLATRVTVPLYSRMNQNVSSIFWTRT